MAAAKRAKMAQQAAAEAAAAAAAEGDADRRVLAQFKSESGDLLGPPLELPHNVTPKQLQILCNKLLQNEDGDLPYSFFVNEEEVSDSLSATMRAQNLTSEEVLQVVYQPQAVFRVRPISQCSATIQGHADNIVELYFSPDGRRLASGSGDKTVRFWDIWTQSPEFTCAGHKHWVQCIAWSPDGAILASAGRDKEIRLWDPTTGKEIGKPLVGHTQFITSLSWEPLHLSPTPHSSRLASSSKDGTVRVWSVSGSGGHTLMSFTQHTKSVTCVKWSGEGLIYTASQDTTIKVWRAADGVMCRSLSGHAHWVNFLSLNTDHVLRTGPFDERGRPAGDDFRAAALERYNKFKESIGGEIMVSASEDNTMYMWKPASEKKPITGRMTGHQKGINHVLFSPDGRLIASGSFDKSAKLWDGKTGKFIGTFRGHVGTVYRLTWSTDSRLLITGSEDSTLKLWSIKDQRLVKDLPGHEGSVYAVDWAPNGETVASAGADKTLKLWRQ